MVVDQLRIRRRDDSGTVEPYYERSPPGVTINWLVCFADFASLRIFASLRETFLHARLISRKDAKIRRRKESLSIDQPSGNLFENGFGFGLDLLFRLILDRVCNIDRVEI